jgi:hypothetical protein
VGSAQALPVKEVNEARAPTELYLRAFAFLPSSSVFSLPAKPPDPAAPSPCTPGCMIPWSRWLYCTPASPASPACCSAGAMRALCCQTSVGSSQLLSCISCCRSPGWGWPPMPATLPENEVGREAPSATPGRVRDMRLVGSSAEGPDSSTDSSVAPANSKGSAGDAVSSLCAGSVA